MKASYPSYKTTDYNDCPCKQNTNKHWTDLISSRQHGKVICLGLQKTVKKDGIIKYINNYKTSRVITAGALVNFRASVLLLF